ncbi:Ethanolamine kinase, partial [Cladochytrium tenue]
SGGGVIVTEFHVVEGDMVSDEAPHHTAATEALVPDAAVGTARAAVAAADSLAPAAAVPVEVAKRITTDDVRLLDVTIDHGALLDGAACVTRLAFPAWEGADIEMKQETDGITNKQGHPFSVEDMQDAHKAALVATRLAQWHKVELPMPRVSKLFATIRKWLTSVPDIFPPSDSPTATKQSLLKSALVKEVDMLEQELSKLNSPVVFSHCDLLCGNLLYTARTDTVSFIDYEYGGYAPRGFDIGNHFCEHAGFDCEWERYPSKDFQLRWLKRYLEASNGETASSEAVHRLYVEVNKYALAAHVFWGIWSIVQSQVSDLDFDYAGYAMLRFNEYWRRKDEFLAL